ncbi:MAG: hypothetical protein U9O54_03350 [Chloroflexota bacterium]|nr:hypothetical protein [Chloroflexota bacterium]
MMQEIEDDPTMARKVRRISHAVRSHDYELEDAIAEAKGHLIIDGEEVCNLDRPRYAPEEGDDSLNDLTMEIVLAWLDAANQVTEVSKGLVDLLNGRRPDELSAPWGQYTLEGIEMIAQALTPFVTFAKLANESNHNHPHPHPHQH